MSRRLLGPVGGPVVFFLVAALVFAGLGWVTYMALGVEHAQRTAAAQTEIGNNLRVALWRLDGRMLPALGVEDSRPFYHYDSADPTGAYGPAATPLLAATLPDWMKLHFQVDPADGWRSNQAPTDPAEADRVRRAWPDMPLRNFYGGREAVLAELKAKFPPRAACDLFAFRDRSMPGDSLPLAAPLFAEVNPPSDPVPANPAPPVPDPTPKPPPPVEVSSALPNPAPDQADTVCVLGFELCLRAPDVQQQQLQQQQAAGNTLANNNDADNNHKKSEQGKGGQAPRPAPVSQANISPRGGRGGPRDGDNERGWSDFFNRMQTISKGLQESKQAYDYPFSRNPGNYQNSLQPGDPRNTTNTAPAQLPAVTLTPTGPGGGPGQAGGPGPGGPAQPTAPPIMPGPMGMGGFGPPPTPQPATPPGDENGAADKAGKRLEQSVKDLMAPRERDARFLGEVLDEMTRSGRPDREKRDAVRAAEESKKLPDEADRDRAGWLTRLREPAPAVPPLTGSKARTAPQVVSEVGAAPPAARPDFVPPGEDRPAPPNPPPAAAVPPPLTVHLGSMRPQWVTAPDGTEMLVLVRTAKFDNRTVYQGVVLDWEKLQAELKKEVQDLFPDARLVPVKDPEGVSPDRAMTALPVQLDPGPEPVLPPAGWTPLRIGLALAWAAAFIAVVAVGFSGWSLIDLAERRIRFVSAVTHELRTPLTSLRLYLDLLVSGMIQDEAKRQEYLNTLATESDRLHRLIDNVLDYAKLEKRRKNGDVKPVKVSELLDQLGRTWTDRVAQDDKELVVVSTLPPEHEVSTDAGMIQQIVGNLIDNARKYTRDAADKRIWLWAKPGSGSGVVLEVEDRGAGVPAGERKAIFKPFRRGEHADSKAGGAGLGLALAKSWAEVLGAKLTYRPADGGVGACFRLELPGK